MLGITLLFLVSEGGKLKLYGLEVSLLGITLLFLVSEGRKLKLYGLEVSLVGVSSFEIEDRKFGNKMFTWLRRGWRNFL